MDALECRGDTALPTAILLLSGVLALPTALLGIAAGQPKSLLTLIAPLAVACWLAARRRYRLILRPDTLEQTTWRGRTVISLRNTTAEIRIPAGIRAARTAHLPCLCLRREGQVVFSLPTYTLRSRDQRTMAEFFRRSTDLPLRHISFLT